jgi:hypothetical protein
MVSGLPIDQQLEEGGQVVEDLAGLIAAQGPSVSRRPDRDRPLEQLFELAIGISSLRGGVTV